MIVNPNDPQNMFSKAGKITSEKYIIFSRKDEIIGNVSKPSKLSNPYKTPLSTNPIVVKKRPQSSIQPFSKQLSRATNSYTKIGSDGQPPCGYYNPKFSELDKAAQIVPDFQKTANKTTPRTATPRQLISRVQSAIDIKINDRPRWKKDCFIDMSKQTGRNDVFFGQPTPHEDRFNFLNITTACSRIPRTPQYSMDKALSRWEMSVYKKENFQPDYHPKYVEKHPNVLKFDKMRNRDDIMTKKADYTFEEYYEFDHYSRCSTSQIFRPPTAPNFGKMTDREGEAGAGSALPSYMRKRHTQNRMGISHLNEKMLRLQE